ncbi:Asp23/Gls24 family envelope stress response protein [Pseudalkalibacillus caeni]|uniref:Asp23/Gls24 family envelope stress response protein n=1 Tax=Exobacillus caeni TaxID=2574798 RepID=A0A5R9F1Z9_9BACL|nr:Asp23/Gls24 family envelope stress response protein [Pseudalkalibacillus caeni]TLS37662.1 Asp23/Gls24 family envelope stress response protein [Pseudalkalibacillus caeni]
MEKQLGEGTLSISQDVIDFIIEVVVDEIEGVQMVVQNVKDKLVGIVNRKKTVYSTEEESQKLTVNVKVGITYGENIPFVCYQVQNRLKEEIENLTGFEVEEINLSVERLEYKD